MMCALSYLDTDCAVLLPRSSVAACFSLRGDRRSPGKRTCFFHGGSYYFLTSGRWCRAAGLQGPWQYASAPLPVMGAPFAFMAFLGIVSRVGVIASHIIVLFDFIEEKHAEGGPFEQDWDHAPTSGHDYGRRNRDRT